MSSGMRADEARRTPQHCARLNRDEENVVYQQRCV